MNELRRVRLVSKPASAGGIEASLRDFDGLCIERELLNSGRLDFDVTRHRCRLPQAVKFCSIFLDFVAESTRFCTKKGTVSVSCSFLGTSRVLRMSNRAFRSSSGVLLVLLLSTTATWAQNNALQASAITEPVVGRVVAPGDLHMEAGPFIDQDAGDTHRAPTGRLCRRPTAWEYGSRSASAASSASTPT